MPSQWRPIDELSADRASIVQNSPETFGMLELADDVFWVRDWRRFGGSGLGLAIAKSIVQAHGGQVRAESRPGEGLEIVFTLPGG